MRRIFLLMNVSIDGYFEAPGHDISWTKATFEAFSAEPKRIVDTLLFGRRTYEMMKSFWPTPQAAQLQPDVTKFMNETCKIVASHNAFDPGWQNVTVFHQNVIEQVKQLKEQPGETIGIFGSNTLCVSLMQAELIDEFQILVNPVALGQGTSLFAGLPQHIELNLSNITKFDSGLVMMTYEPMRA